MCIQYTKWSVIITEPVTSSKLFAFVTASPLSCPSAIPVLRAIYVSPSVIETGVAPTAKASAVQSVPPGIRS